MYNRSELIYDLRSSRPTRNERTEASHLGPQLQMSILQSDWLAERTDQQEERRTALLGLAVLLHTS